METLLQVFEKRSFSIAGNIEELAHYWQNRLADECSQHSEATREGITNWLLGIDKQRLENLDAKELKIAKQAMEYRYQILCQRYLGMSRERGYRNLITRLGSLATLRSKIQTWISFSGEHQLGVLDVLQDILQELFQSDNYMISQIVFISQLTQDSRLRNALLFASLEEYCMRTIRNQPLLVYRFINYLKRTQHGNLTQLPRRDLVGLVSQELLTFDGENQDSLVDRNAILYYQEDEKAQEQQVHRQLLKEEFSEYLQDFLGEDARMWLQLYLKGFTQDAIAKKLGKPIKEIYRLREKIGYHAVRVFALKDKPELITNCLETSLQEHNLGLAPNQWQQLEVMTYQVMGKLAKVYPSAQEIRIQRDYLQFCITGITDCRDFDIPYITGSSIRGILRTLISTTSLRDFTKIGVITIFEKLKSKIFTPELLNSFSSRSLILQANPGMGKSTLGISMLSSAIFHDVFKEVNTSNINRHSKIFFNQLLSHFEHISYEAFNSAYISWNLLKHKQYKLNNIDIFVFKHLQPKIEDRLLCVQEVSSYIFKFTGQSHSWNLKIKTDEAKLLLSRCYLLDFSYHDRNNNLPLKEVNAAINSNIDEEYYDSNDSYYIKFLKEYYDLVNTTELSEEQAERLSEILEIAEQNEKLSLLFNEIDNLVMQELNLLDEKHLQVHEKQKISLLNWLKILADYLSNKSEKLNNFIGMNNSNFVIIKEEENFDLLENTKSNDVFNLTPTDYIELLKEYYDLINATELSEERAERLSEILEIAEQNEKLSLLFNEIDNLVMQELNLLDEKHLQLYEKQKASLRELVEKQLEIDNYLELAKDEFKDCQEYDKDNCDARLKHIEDAIRGEKTDELIEYEKLVKDYSLRVELASLVQDYSGQMEALNKLGTAYFSIGEYQQSIRAYQKNLDLARKCNDTEKEKQALSFLKNLHRIKEEADNI